MWCTRQYLSRYQKSHASHTATRILLNRSQNRSIRRVEIHFALSKLSPQVSRIPSKDTVDGPWVQPTVGEAQTAKRDAWKLLCELTSDADPSIANRARKIATDNLRAAIPWGAGSYTFDMLAELVSNWDEKELADLREQLDAAKKYEGPALQQDEALATALTQLRTETEAQTFHGRLMDVVGRWFPGDREIDGITQAGFSECIIGDTTTAYIEYREGNEATTPRKLSGLTKYGNITLKWGITDAMELYNWQKQVIGTGAEGARKNMSIVVVDEAGNDKARWDIVRAWPVRY